MCSMTFVFYSTIAEVLLRSQGVDPLLHRPVFREQHSLDPWISNDFI